MLAVQFAELSEWQRQFHLSGHYSGSFQNAAATAGSGSMKRQEIEYSCQKFKRFKYPETSNKSEATRSSSILESSGRLSLARWGTGFIFCD